MTKKSKPATDLPTEEKIKKAAREVFTRKGYAATRTRDIAEEAGINLALLNYYFRSKQKLFEEVMLEKIQQLFGLLAPAINDPSTNLETKVERIVSLYTDMLAENPDLPIFVLSEIRNHPEHFAKTFQIGKIIQDSSFIHQLKEKRPDVNPLHFLMSIMGMTLFPFIAMPVFKAISAIDEKQFHHLMQERKSYIPLWMNAVLNAK